MYFGQDSANSPGITSYTLTIGTDQKLYTGSPTALVAGAQVPFGIPPQCSNYRGRVNFQVVPTAGTVTTITGDVEISMDGGITWSKLTGQTGLLFVVATVPAIISVDLSGMGGSGKIRLNFTTFTVTAGVFDVWAHAG